MSNDLEDHLRYVGEGWKGLIRKMYAKIIAVDPDIEIKQVKERFGALIFYWSSPNNDLQEEVQKLVDSAEEISMTTCRVCGASKTPTESRSGWLTTTCEQHSKE